jgi:hypothetical protein
VKERGAKFEVLLSLQRKKICWAFPEEIVSITRKSQESALPIK